MSSRQEEKEQRKRERLEREAAERKVAKRKRLLQILAGVVIGAAGIAAVVLVVLGGGDDDKRDSGDLTAAAKAAGCVVKKFPSEGQGHVTKKLKAADFKTNPPTSGDHNATPAQDGVYAPANEPEIENWVHTLEHGRILIMYGENTPPARTRQLESLYNEETLGKPAYHAALMQNNTGMPFEVAAVAWRNYVGCETFSEGALDAIRAFRDVYVDTAPEQVP